MFAGAVLSPGFFFFFKSQIFRAKGVPGLISRYSKRMENLTAVITGASSGIGLAYAEYYARQGYSLILTARRIEILQKIQNDLSSRYGCSVEIRKVDLSSAEETENLARELSGIKDLAVLVNNAGFGSPKPFSADSYANQYAMLSVHVLAVTRLTHEVLPGMKQKGSGAIINVASIAGFFPAPLDSMYSGTKAFLVRWSEALQQELVDTGVKVQALCPGFIRTGFHEQLGLGKGFNQKNSGVFRWMEPARIVADSVKSLQKKNPPVILVPGLFYKFIYMIHKLTPRKIIYCTMKGKMMNRVE